MILHGDCLEEMKKMGDNSISGIVTDPPYGLSFMGKGWDHAVPGIEYWREAFRILKPAGHILAMGGTRTVHRLTSAIEESGFEIRDCIMWIYGSGFPKSHNQFGCEGYGTALKPAYEPIIMAMKPCDGTFKQNYEKWDQAGINIDGCRIPRSDTDPNHRHNPSQGNNGETSIFGCGGHNGNLSNKGRWPANVIFDEFNERILALKDNIPNDIISVIQEYYCDYKLPGLSEENRNLSKSRKKEKRTVLQSGVLLAGSNGTDEKRETSDVGQETQERVCSENATEQENVKGEGQSQVSGLLVQSGLSSYQPFGADSDSTSVSKTDDKTARDSRTSNNSGNIAESSSHASGSCPSSEWCEERQQNRKPGNDEQLDSQNGTQGDSERTPSIEIRERTLKVLACDVPERWLKYFSDSGEEIRSPHCAAKMLDEQSGECKPPGNKANSFGDAIFGSDIKTRNIPGQNCYPGQSGGASRFFYCAKTSSRERNEGLEGMPLVEGGFKNDSGRGIARDKPYDPVKYRNNHPTVKPLKLMRYLITLIMPPKDGVLLDPFAGSGSTIIAAHQLGVKAIGIEKQAEYVEIAKKRLEYYKSFEDEKEPDLFDSAMNQ